MTTKTRAVVALATLSLATAAYAIDDPGSGSADAAATASVPGLLAGGSHVHDGIRTTVLEFRNAGLAGSKAGHLLLKAHNARRDSIVCDLHKQPLSVAGVPGARGVVVDNQTRNGSSTKIATIVFTKGQFTFQLSSEARPGSLRIGQLKREARRAYRSLAA